MERQKLPAWCTKDEPVPSGSEILNAPLRFDRGARVLIGSEPDPDPEHALTLLKDEARRIFLAHYEPMLPKIVGRRAQ